MRTASANACAALLLVGLSCSEPGPSSPVGEYVIDLDASPFPWIDHIRSMGMTLHSDMTYEGSAVLLLTGQTEEEQHSTKGTWTLQNGTITLTQTHEDGEEHAMTATATLEDGVMTVFMGGEPASVWRKR